MILYIALGSVVVTILVWRSIISNIFIAQRNIIEQFSNFLPVFIDSHTSLRHDIDSLEDIINQKKLISKKKYSHIPSTSIDPAEQPINSMKRSYKNNSRCKYEARPKDHLKFVYDYICTRYRENNNKPLGRDIIIHTNTLIRRLGPVKKIRHILKLLLEQGRVTYKRNSEGVITHIIPVINDNIIETNDTTKHVAKKNVIQ